MNRQIDQIVAKLKSEDESTQLKALLQLGKMEPAAIEVIPSLREFLNGPSREDLKLYAEKLLAKIDPNFRRERESTQFLQARAERARSFSEKAQAGQAAAQELVTALRELPEAIPVTAKALGGIGFEEMSRRSRGRRDMTNAILMLNQIVSSNEPLETRLAAAEAFQLLQPTRERLIYTVEETAPAFETIKNALPKLSGPTRTQVESRFGGMLEKVRIMWTVKQHPGEVTDYSGAEIMSFARDLEKVDKKTYQDFVAAMRKADPKFLERP